MKNLWTIYNKFEEYVLASSLIVTVILVFMQIIFRYVLNASLSWSEELTRYIFIWQIWLGTSYGLRDDKHIKIELVYNFCKPVGKKFLKIISNLIFLAFCIFLTINGTELVMELATKHSVSSALNIPFAIVYASLPFSSFIVILRLIGQIFGIIRTPTSTLADGKGGN